MAPSPSFYCFAHDAFGAEEAGRICEKISRHMGAKSKCDPRRENPVSVLDGLSGNGRLRDVLGVDHFVLSAWCEIDRHQDGSCKLSVRLPPTTTEMVPVEAVVVDTSTNTTDATRDEYIFKGTKDARHAAAFIIAVSILDHIGGASRCVLVIFCLLCFRLLFSIALTHASIAAPLSFNRDWSKYLPGSRPSQPSQPSPPSPPSQDVPAEEAPEPESAAPEDAGGGTSAYCCVVSRVVICLYITCMCSLNLSFFLLWNVISSR